MSKIVILKNQTYLSSKSIYHNLEGGGRVSLENALNHIYPVGSIFITTVNQDPSPYLGGKWEAFGAGRVLVGFDSSQKEFNTILKTGGSKVHSHGNGNLAAAIEITWNGQNIIKIGNYQNRPMATNIAMKGLPTYYNENTNTATGCRVEGSTSNSSTLQPYIVVYMFKRIS
jgi:hypothetical protein